MWLTVPALWPPQRTDDNVMETTFANINSTGAKEKGNKGN